MKRFEHPRSGKDPKKAKKRAEDAMYKEECAKMDADWAEINPQLLAYSKSAEKTKAVTTPQLQQKIGAEWKNTQVFSLGRPMQKTIGPFCASLSAQKYPLSEVCENTPNLAIVGTSNLRKDKGSSYKKVQFAEIVHTQSPNKRTSTTLARKLFVNNEGINKNNITTFSEGDDNLNDSILNKLDNSSDSINSSMEFNQYETMCSSPVMIVKLSKEEINDELKSFIKKQNAEMFEKINSSFINIMNENTNIILAKINEMNGESNVVTNNETAIDSNVAQKKKAPNLRVKVMKKALNAKCPDTPATHMKMKKSIDIYKTLSQGLDSPRPHRSLLNTPEEKVEPKTALSRKVQKQCYALIDG